MSVYWRLTPAKIWGHPDFTSEMSGLVVIPNASVMRVNSQLNVCSTDDKSFSARGQMGID